VRALPQDLEKSDSYPFRPGWRRLRAPSWAADGQHLSVSADGHTGSVLTFDDRGGSVKPWVLNYEGQVGRSIYAPRGGRLAVESLPASGFYHVLVIDTLSGRTHDIGSENLNYSAVEPGWSADAEKLAVVAFSGSIRTAMNPNELLVFSADGALLSRAASGDVHDPAWNPAR